MIRVQFVPPCLIFREKTSSSGAAKLALDLHSEHQNHYFLSRDTRVAVGSTATASCNNTTTVCEGVYIPENTHCSSVQTYLITAMNSITRLTIRRSVQAPFSLFFCVSFGVALGGTRPAGFCRGSTASTAPQKGEGSAARLCGAGVTGEDKSRRCCSCGLFPSWFTDN